MDDPLNSETAITKRLFAMSRGSVRGRSLLRVSRFWLFLSSISFGLAMAGLFAVPFLALAVLISLLSVLVLPTMVVIGLVSLWSKRIDATGFLRLLGINAVNALILIATLGLMALLSNH